MNFDTLNELVAIPKKTDASKKTVKSYKTEIVALLNEEGFSDNAEKYLWAGFSFCGAEALFDYLNCQPIEQQIAVLDSLLKCTTFVKNEKCNGFKMCISLLVYELNYASENIEIIGLLVKACTWKYKLKDGSISKDNSKTIEKYFVSALTSKANFPDWNSINIKREFKLEFCSYIRSVCNSIANTKILPQVNALRSWLDSVEAAEQTVQAVTPLDTPTDTTKTIVDGTSHIGDVPARVEQVSLFAIAAQLKELTARVGVEADNYSKMKRMLAVAKSNNEELRAELTTEQELSAQYQQKLKEAEAIIQQNSIQIEALSAEVDKLKSIINVYSEDKQSSMDGQLNSIASKLKVVYSEFKDAMDCDMTVEIGEILRDQMMTIFKILAKEGINIEGR